MKLSAISHIVDVGASIRLIIVSIVPAGPVIMNDGMKNARYFNAPCVEGSHARLMQARGDKRRDNIAVFLHWRRMTHMIGDSLSYCRAAGAVLLVLMSLNASALAVPADEIARFGSAGQGIPACASCHGLAGEGNDVSGIPRLAGLPAIYLAAQLEALADRQRDNAMMSPVADTLNRDQRRALADYYAALPVPAAPAGPAVQVDDDIVALVEHGSPEAGIPGCAQCHGERGVGVGERFPPLAGQSATYLVHQLENWQQHRRSNGPQGLMGEIAQRLDPSTFQPLADYLAAQPPGPLPAEASASGSASGIASDQGDTP